MTEDTSKTRLLIDIVTHERVASALSTYLDAQAPNPYIAWNTERVGGQERYRVLPLLTHSSAIEHSPTTFAGEPRLMPRRFSPVAGTLR